MILKVTEQKGSKNCDAFAGDSALRIQKGVGHKLISLSSQTQLLASHQKSTTLDR